MHNRTSISNMTSKIMSPVQLAEKCLCVYHNLHKTNICVSSWDFCSGDGSCFGILDFNTVFLPNLCRARWEPGGTRWCTGEEVKEKLVNGVGSQYSHATSEHGVSSITQANVHTSAASSRLNLFPHRFKWTHPFWGKMKSGFCVCAITFRTSYTYLSQGLTGYSPTHPCYILHISAASQPLQLDPMSDLLCNSNAWIGA
jgi:hypothetical protein